MEFLVLFALLGTGLLIMTLSEKSRIRQLEKEKAEILSRREEEEKKEREEEEKKEREEQKKREQETQEWKLKKLKELAHWEDDFSHDNVEMPRRSPWSQYGEENMSQIVRRIYGSPGYGAAISKIEGHEYIFDNSLENSPLFNTYEKLRALGAASESFDIVRMVHDYRLYFKPEKVKTVLLAESHVYTSHDDFQSELSSDYLNLPGYPKKYVRFVYCLGYGENELLNKPIPKNSGTPQFWKIFYSCCNETNSTGDCDPVLSSKTTALRQRIQNKLELLNTLKEQGIWLLDASVVGLYIPGGSKPTQNIREVCIRSCWDLLIRDILIQEDPERLICIGKGVYGTLQYQLKKLFKDRITVNPLPSAFLKSAEHTRVLKSYYDLCNMDSVR